MLRKELKEILKRAGCARPAPGLTRLFINDEVWDYRVGECSLACVNPLTKESFGLSIGNLNLDDSVAVKTAILRKAFDLRQDRIGRKGGN